MENQQAQISVKDVMEKITLLIKGEIVAMYTEEDNVLQIRFLNGQSFRVFVEEIE